MQFLAWTVLLVWPNEKGAGFLRPLSVFVGEKPSYMPDPGP